MWFVCLFNVAENIQILQPAMTGWLMNWNGYEWEAVVA
jgi:hypothetical protein